MAHYLLLLRQSKSIKFINLLSILYIMTLRMGYSAWYVVCCSLATISIYAKSILKREINILL